MDRYRWIRLGALAAVLASALAVGGAFAAGNAPTEYQASGTWQSDKGTTPGTWKGTLYRSPTSDALSGTISVDGATAIADAVVVGSMDKSNITFGLLHGGAAVAEFSGSASGASLSGTYRFDALRDVGSWKGTLVER